AADRLRDRIQQHLALLTATAAHLKYLEAPLTRDRFLDYVSSLGLQSKYNGIQGLGYAAVLGAEDDRWASDRILREYEVEREVRPASSAGMRTSIVLLE